MKRMALAIAMALAFAAAPAVAQPTRGAGILAAMDGNGDGQVTRAEARASREALFRRMDGDGDGFVTQVEREALAQNGRGRNGGRIAAAADGDGDGRVSRAEFMARPYRGFDRADSDNNDIVTTAEIEALQAQAGGG